MTAAGRPLDAIVDQCKNLNEVNCLMQPRPAAASERSSRAEVWALTHTEGDIDPSVASAPDGAVASSKEHSGGCEKFSPGTSIFQCLLRTLPCY